MIKLSAQLPASLLIGTRLAVRRPRRLILTLAGTAVTVIGLVAVLIMHAAEANPELIAPNDPLKARLSEVAVIISAVLVAFAAVNAIFIAWTTALETRHAASLAAHSERPRARSSRACPQPKSSPPASAPVGPQRRHSTQ